MNQRKRASSPLNAADIKDFLGAKSDFAFEMEVVRMLRGRGWSCSHAATFVDHVTGKTRAFDIRARQRQQLALLTLAVECKHLTPNAPLIVHATPRLPEESHHAVLVRRVGMSNPDPFVRRIAPSAMYPPNAFVGRQPDQPLRAQDGTWAASDRETYEKWSQAVNSARDLFESLVRENHSERTVAAVMPVLAIPNGTLWQVSYHEDGTRVGDPEEVDRVQLYLGHSWQCDKLLAPRMAWLSHLEICTVSGLDERLTDFDGIHGPLAKALDYL